MVNMTHMIEDAGKRTEVKNTILSNADLFADFLFSKKGFFHAWECKLNLKKHKSNDFYKRTFLPLRFQHMEKQKAPLDFLKFLSSIYSKEMMTFCVEQNKDITYYSLGFSNTVLADIYIHYLLNRKRLIAGDLRNREMLIDIANKKDQNLKALIDKLYD